MWSALVYVPVIWLALIGIGAGRNPGLLFAALVGPLAIAGIPRVLLAMFRCPRCHRLFHMLGNTSTAHCIHCGLPRYGDPERSVAEYE